jgi:N-dimethylarginine dimethylaminohydrolase
MNMGTNIVALGDERVLIPAAGKQLIKQCRAEGLEIFSPDVAMIAAGGGSVHCMCQALRRDSVR